MNSRTLARAWLGGLAAALLAACGGGGEPPADGRVFRFDASASAFRSCDALQDYLARTNAQQARLAGIGAARVGVVSGGDQAAVNAPTAGGAGSAEDSSGAETFTGTNNQETGVDEADFVKTDAEFIYLLSGGGLRIVDAWPPTPGSLRERSTTPIEGAPQVLFVHQGVAWVASSVFDTPAADASTAAFAPPARLKITLLNIADVDAPQVLREVYLDGFYSAARMIDGRVYLALDSGYPLYYGAPVAVDFATSPEYTAVPPQGLPQRIDVPWDNGAAGAPVTSNLVDCADVYRAGSPSGTGMFTLVAFDLGAPDQNPGSSAILGNAGVVYASADAFYVATYEDAAWLWLALDQGDSEPRPGTAVHKFRLGDKPEYAASGHVDGQVLNQFSMSEHQQHLRIATTEFRWWQTTASGPLNRLYVLAETDRELVVSGQLDDIGKPNETIFAARFQGDRGFVVTAQRTDPLYTLDLSDPSRPRKVGELEVPGFSTYLHPLSDDRLLAIGRDGSNRLQLSLFDVSEFAAPRRVANYSAAAHAYSGAEHDHHAFTYYPERGLLAIPVIEQTAWTGFTDSRPPFEDALRLFAIGATAITPLGEVDHTEFYDRAGYWYFPGSIQRSLFKGSADRGDFVYAISPGAITVTDVDELATPVDALPLPLADEQRWYPYTPAL